MPIELIAKWVESDNTKEAILTALINILTPHELLTREEQGY